jgi:hypothetical protein
MFKPKVTRAAMLALGILAGCATLTEPSTSEQLVTKYVEKAQSEVDACMASARPMSRSTLAPGAEEVKVAQMCSASDPGLEALFDDAEHAARFERGTRMYLSMYHDQWIALTRAIQQEDVATDARLRKQEPSLAAERAALTKIAHKLSSST